MYDGDEVGYLTYEQFSRFQRAVHYSLKLVPWLRVAGYVKTGDPDDVRTAAVHPPLGLPPTWIAAEDITRMSRELQSWPDLEDVAADDYGAEVAVQFTREVETAAFKWPFEERPHRVQYIRCPSCGITALRYMPPAFGGDAVTVKCTECRQVVSADRFAALVALKAAEVQGIERRLDNGGSGGGVDGPHETDDLQVGAVGEGGDSATGARFVA